MRSLEIPLFLEVSPGAIERVPDILRDINLHFKSVLVISGDSFTRELAQIVVQSLRGNTHCRTVEVRKSSIKEVKRIQSSLKDEYFDVVIGVGGGKVLDVAKMVAYRKNLRFISIPTIVSNDGICSPVSVLEDNDRKLSLGAVLPLGIIIDLTVIRKAPERFLRAGIGDLLSNLSAVWDWRLAHKRRGEEFAPFSALLSEASARSVLFTYPHSIDEDIFLEKVIEGLIMSGLAMGIAGSSRPCSGSEHEITHALDRLLPNTSLHGEKVGIATLFTLYLQGNHHFQEVKDFMSRHRLPLSLKDISIGLDDFIEAVKFAPKTRPDRFTILEDIKLREQEIRDIILRVGIA